MFKSIIIVMGILMSAWGNGPVLKTGQTISYAEFDDGYYQIGVDRVYDNTTKPGIVIDNVTKLEWQDDYSGNGGLIKSANWQEAIDYCPTLNLSGASWRLPSIEELETIVNHGTYDPSLDEGVFTFVSSSFYWSSTPYVESSFRAFVVHFYGGDSYTLTTNRYPYEVRCVRGEALEASDFTRVSHIITDYTTGLQWQDDSTAATTQVTWSEAINHCENTLNLGGHSDWRLPNKNELLSIVDQTRASPAIDITYFLNTAIDYYWSSTTLAEDTSIAWTVEFDDFYTDYFDKTDSIYVRCVRGGQVEPSILIPILTNINLPYKEAIKPESFNLYIEEITDFDASNLSVTIDESAVSVLETITEEGAIGIKLAFEDTIVNAGEHTVTLNYNDSEATITVNTSVENSEPFRTTKQSGGFKFGRGLKTSKSGYVKVMGSKVKSYSVPTPFSPITTSAAGGISIANQSAYELLAYTDESAGLLTGSTTKLNVEGAAKAGIGFSIPGSPVTLNLLKGNISANGFASTTSMTGRFYYPSEKYPIAASIVPMAISMVSPTALTNMLAEAYAPGIFYKTIIHYGFDFKAMLSLPSIVVKPKRFVLNSSLASFTLTVGNLDGGFTSEWFLGNEGGKSIELHRVKTETNLSPFGGKYIGEKNDDIFNLGNHNAHEFEFGMDRDIYVFRSVFKLDDEVHYTDYPINTPFVKRVDDYHLPYNTFKDMESKLGFFLDNNYTYTEPVLVKHWLRSDDKVKDFGIEVALPLSSQTFEASYLNSAYEDALSGISYKIGNKTYVIYANTVGSFNDTPTSTEPHDPYRDYATDVVKLALEESAVDLYNSIKETLVGGYKALEETVEAGVKVLKDADQRTVLKAWKDAPANMYWLYNHLNSQNQRALSIQSDAEEDSQEMSAINNANLTFHSDILELELSDGDAGGEVILYATYDPLALDTGIYRYSFDEGQWKRVENQSEDGGLKFHASQSGYYALIDAFPVTKSIFENDIYSVESGDSSIVVSDPIYLSDGSLATEREFNLTITDSYSFILDEYKMGVNPFTLPVSVTSDSSGQVSIPVQADTNPGRATVTLSAQQGYTEDSFDMVVFEYGTDAPVEGFIIDLNITGGNQVGDTITVHTIINKTHDTVTIKIISPSGEVFIDDTTILDMVGTWTIIVETIDENGYVRQVTSIIEVSANLEKYPCGFIGYFIQGTTTCVEADPVSIESNWLPECSAGQRLIQGTGSCELATPAETPGFTLPTCPDGARLTQGTEECVIYDTVSFASDVMPILVDYCISCHSITSNNRTFKVGDAAYTYSNITTNSLINTVSPDLSSILTKGNEEVSHNGGDKLSDVNSQIVRDWIEQGGWEN